LDGNQFTTVPRGVFEGVGSTLTGLFLQENKIVRIDERAFEKLDKLEELYGDCLWEILTIRDLDKNSFTVIDKSFFRFIPGLKSLRFCGNPVTSFPADLFAFSTQLETL
jgi:hypothetical protein